jgi:hypothetical protein
MMEQVAVELAVGGQQPVRHQWDDRPGLRRVGEGATLFFQPIDRGR